MKNSTNTNDSQENSRPENCISPVLSDPPAKKRSKSKQNRDSNARRVESQPPKTAANEPSTGEKEKESTGPSEGGAEDELRCADEKSTGPSGSDAEDELRCADKKGSGPNAGEAKDELRCAGKEFVDTSVGDSARGKEAEPNDHPAPPRRGQFQRGQSGNPKGRPKGAFNRSTLAARAILERNSALLTEAAVKLAIAGSPIAIKLCLERLISIPSDSPITLKLPPDPKDPSETYASHNAVLRAVAEGKITPQEGRHLSAIVDARRRSWESTELADRMTDLESRLPKRKG